MAPTPFMRGDGKWTVSPNPGAVRWFSAPRSKLSAFYMAHEGKVLAVLSCVGVVALWWGTKS